MAEPTKEAPESTLILCVDRDDDLGVKVGIKTPILGREETLNAAINLALRDPEEPDANAMFEAIRIYDHLKEGEEARGKYQVATIAGSSVGGVGADKKLVSELTQVLKTFQASDVILVTDGYTDEAILPLVESRVPVTSVRRVVVKHSKAIEETAALFSRYLKMVTENPRYARIALGLPGVFLIVVGVLSFLSAFGVFGIQAIHIWITFFLVFGSFLFIKGFGIDKTFLGFYRWIREYSPPPFPVQIAVFSTVAGTLLIVIGCYQGAYVVSSYIPTPLPQDFGQWLALLPGLVGWFLSQAIFPIVTGVCVLLLGRAIRWFLERDPRLLRTIIVVVACAWSWQIFYRASEILINPSLAYTELVAAIIIGVVLTVTTFFATTLLHRKYRGFFVKKVVETEEIEQD